MSKGPISVIVRGGDELRLGLRRSTMQFRNVTLTGPAEFVFEGTIEFDRICSGVNEQSQSN